MRKYKMILGIVFCAFLSGCLVQSAKNKDTDAVEVSALSGGSEGGGGSAAANCAQNAFRLNVHPVLTNYCNNCHGSAHGSADLPTSYNSAKSKSNFANPSASRIVDKAKISDHCQGCGTGLGSNLTTLISTWALAESNDPTTCAEYNTDPNSGPGGGSADPFLLGPYQPPSPNNTRVDPAGLAEFSSVGGVQEILVSNCIQCHIPGGIASGAPFAVSNSLNAYREAKPRSNFSSIDNSLLLYRASVSNHGGGCLICGQSAFITRLRGAISDWASAENASSGGGGYTLVNKTVTVSGSGVQTITWNLQTEASPAQSALNGATFSIQVALLNAFTWRITNPTLRAGAQGATVDGIWFVVNNTVDPAATSYIYSSAVLAPFQTLVLENFAALVASNPSNLLGIQFNVLGPQ